LNVSKADVSVKKAPEFSLVKCIFPALFEVSEDRETRGSGQNRHEERAATKEVAHDGRSAGSRRRSPRGSPGWLSEILIKTNCKS